MSDRHIVIVGGGVIGVCSAYFLARRGCRVTLLERGAIAGAASFGNAGCIAPGHAPINRPGRMAQALKWMLDETSPLYIAPRLDPSLAAWLWAFRRRCTAEHLAHCMGVLGPLGHRSQALFDAIVRDEALDCDYRAEGYYHVFATEAARDAERGGVEAMAALGYALRLVDGDELRSLDPAFSDAVVGAMHWPGATCDPARFVTGLADAAARHGATLRTGVEVEALEVRGGRARGVRAGGEVVEADAVLLATGAAAQPLLAQVRVRLPLQPAKGYHRDFPRSESGPGALRTPCMLAETYIFCTPMGERVRFAGTLELSGPGDGMRPARLRQLTRGAQRYLREPTEVEGSTEWMGKRPCLPDGLPAIGPISTCDGLWVANGHAMKGLTFGPVTGELVSQGMLGDRPAFDLAPLSPERRY